MNDSVFATVNVNQRISGLLRPRLHDTSDTCPTRNGMCASRLLIEQRPEVGTIGSFELTA